MSRSALCLLQAFPPYTDAINRFCSSITPERPPVSILHAYSHGGEQFSLL
jgi:hypothetical protein